MGVGMMIETARLILRRPRLADVPALFAFLGDAGAMRHAHADASPQECRRRIAAHERQRRRTGFGPFTILSRADGRIIGWGGLYEDLFEPGWGAELGYFFHPAAWGRGHATELAAACMDLADHVLRLPELSAFAHPQNAASRRVLEKAGFAPVRFIPEMERDLYRRVRP
jgi:ribosomal-protein-alanine N-acetyltransferase